MFCILAHPKCHGFFLPSWPQILSSKCFAILSDSLHRIPYLNSTRRHVPKPQNAIIPTGNDRSRGTRIRQRHHPTAENNKKTYENVYERVTMCPAIHNTHIQINDPQRTRPTDRLIDWQTDRRTRVPESSIQVRYMYRTWKNCRILNEQVVERLRWCWMVCVLTWKTKCK